MNGIVSIKRLLKNNNGNAIVIALTISIILFTLMVTAVLLIRQQTKLITGSRSKASALAVAEAGLDAAIWRLERNQTLPFETDGDGDNTKHTITGSNTQGTFSVEVKKVNDTKFEITSTSTKASSNEKRAIREDIYYINLSRSIATLSSVSGGGTVTGNVNIWGPFYTSGSLSLGGTASVANLVGTSGNPFLVGGNLSLSGNAQVGSASSPMSVFVEGAINNPSKVYTKVSNVVPDVSLPDVVKTQYLNAAEANDNAIYTGNLTLGNEARSFSHFNYSGGTSPTLTVEGTVYINGNLVIDTSNESVTYLHASGKQATIFVNGTITIDDELKAASGYPADSVLALINEDQNPNVQTDDDIYISVAPGKLVQTFIYTSGRLHITRQATIEGSIVAKVLYLDNVPDLKAPSTAVQNNYPALYPAKDLAILTSANWREVTPQ